MATTMKKIVRKALQKSGVLTKGEEPDTDEYQDALDAINAMLSSWSNDSMLIPARAWETFTLTGGLSLYTMGVGGSFNTARPISIISCQCNLGGTDNDVAVVDDSIFNSQIAVKTAPGFPSMVNFDNAYPTMNVRFWPVPAANYPVKILSEKLLTQFGINDAVDLPPGWERGLIYNGAIEVSGDYAQEVPASVAMIAKESKGLIRKAINKARSMDCQPTQNNSGNIYSGYWN